MTPRRRYAGYATTGDAAWRDLLTQEASLHEYLVRRVSLASDGVECDAQRTAPPVEWQVSGAKSSFRSSTCAPRLLSTCSFAVTCSSTRTRNTGLLFVG